MRPSEENFSLTRARCIRLISIGIILATAGWFLLEKTLLKPGEPGLPTENNPTQVHRDRTVDSDLHDGSQGTTPQNTKIARSDEKPKRGESASLGGTRNAVEIEPMEGELLTSDFLDRIVQGKSLSLTMPDGTQIRGEAEILRKDEKGILIVQAQLTDPAKGFLYLQRQTTEGVLGPFFGHVRFHGEDRAWKIEPSEDLKSAKFVARHISTVMCSEYATETVKNEPHAHHAGCGPTCRERSSSTSSELGEIMHAPSTHPTDIPLEPNPAVIRLESLPGATGVIYLDFDGEKGPFPSWGYVYYSGGVMDAAHSGMDNTKIFNIWKRVAEDYLPFNLNVTTDRAVFDAAPPGRRQHAIITPTAAGGAAYVGSFNSSENVVCWIKSDTERNTAEVISHEVGHTLLLVHHGVIKNGAAVEYYDGQGGSWPNHDWAPIMGRPYLAKISQWSRGDYPNATNSGQDDLDTIANRNNNVGFRADDTGSTQGTARYLRIRPDKTVSSEGIIETTGDVDAYRFRTTGGLATINVDPDNPDTNLDIYAEIVRASDLTIVASNNPESQFYSRLSVTLSAGEYLVRVKGTGRGTLSTGYSNYGSLGSYFITGSVVGGVHGDFPQIAEHSPNGTAVTTVSPRNSHGSATLQWAIASGNTGNTFAINSNTGAITVANNALLDHETLSTRWDDPAEFELFVTITNLSNASLNESIRVVVTINDVNEAPVMAASSFEVFQNIPIGTFVGKVIATDPDQFDWPRFSIISNDPNGYFEIDSYTGVIRTKALLTIAGGTVFPIVVQAVDQRTPVNSVTANIQILINSPPYWTQNFDSVTAPQLPSGWVTVGTAQQWRTISDTRDTSPNSAFIPEANNAASTSELTSPVIAVNQANPRLQFRNYYNTARDGAYIGAGGMLRIKIGTEAWQDIITAGGSWVEGGYNINIGTGWGNPLEGSRAWGGNSNGFITSIVNLPARAVGQNVQFKWIYAIDGYPTWGGGVGWFIDSISLGSGFTVGGTPALQVTPGSYDFGSTSIGQTNAKSFVVTNTRTQSVSGSISVSAPFSIVGATTFNLGAGQSTTVNVSFAPQAAGVYHGRLSFVSSGNVIASQILKGTGTTSGTAVEVTQWPTASGITYGQALSASTLGGGTASVAGAFAFTSPATIPNAGTYSAAVTFTPTNTSLGTVSGTVSVAVAKATPTVSAWPTASSITYGQALSASVLSGGTASVSGTFAFTAPTTIPNAGTYSAAVTFTPNNTTNYNTRSGTISVVVAKITPTVSSWPTASAISSGQPLSSSTLSGGTASVAGTFAFNTPSFVPNVGTYSAAVTFSPTNTNYQTVGGTVSVTVTAANRVPENPSNLVQGVEYKYYEGSWSVLPNFASLTAVQSGNLSNFLITTRRINDHFGFKFSGFIDVPVSGAYTFYTTSDDGSALYIGSTKVVDNDGLHSMRERSGTIALAAGKHAISVEFFDASGGDGLQVHWQGPGFAKQIIPNDKLWRSDTLLPWTPSHIVALRAWYDANDGNSVTISSGAVSQWNDKSGNNRHVSQSVSTQRPTISASTISFDGSNDYLMHNAAFMYAAGSVDLYIVGAVATDADRRIVSENHATNNNPLYNIAQTNSTSGSIMGVYIRSDSNSIRLTNTTNLSAQGAFSRSVPKLYQWRDTGSSVSSRVAGGSPTTVNYTRNTTTLNRFTLGAIGPRVSGSTAGSWFVNAGLNEVVITPNLSDSDRQKMEGYLAHKWDAIRGNNALVTALPGGHPWKASPPRSTTTPAYTVWASAPSFNLAGDTKDDDDGDGISNFQEFAFGSNPIVPSEPTPVTMTREEGSLLVRYERTTGAGLNYSMWTSTDLVVWNGPVTMTEQVVETRDDGTEVVEATVTNPPTDPTLFIRMKAE